MVRSQDQDTEQTTASCAPLGTVCGVCDYDGRHVPAPGEFRPIRAHDLSDTGIAFVTSQWPTTTRLSLLLGDNDEPAVVVARIVSCCATKVGTPSMPRYEVRCEFENGLRTTEPSDTEISV